MKEIKIIFAFGKMTMWKWTYNDPKIRKEFGEHSTGYSGRTINEFLSEGGIPQRCFYKWESVGRTVLV